MKCEYCKDKRKLKKPNNQKDFEYWYDHFLEGDFCSPSMAEEKAYKKVGYTWIDCPHCKTHIAEEDGAND